MREFSAKTSPLGDRKVSTSRAKLSLSEAKYVDRGGRHQDKLYRCIFTCAPSPTLIPPSSPPLSPTTHILQTNRARSARARLRRAFTCERNSHSVRIPRRHRRHITRSAHEYHCAKGAISLRLRRNITATHRVARSPTQKGQPLSRLPPLLNSINFSCGSNNSHNTST